MGFEKDENQEEYEQAPRSYLRQGGRKPAASRKFLQFAIIAAAVAVLLAAGAMLLLPGGDDSGQEVSNKKTLEIGNAGDLPEAPSGAASASESGDAAIPQQPKELQEAISDMEDRLRENHEQVMGRLVELAKRVVENNDQTRETLSMIESLEERMAVLEKQYQQYQLAAEPRSGGQEQSREDAGDKSGQDGRDKDDSKTSDSDSGQPEDRYYTVKKNDTLYSIAKNHGIKLETLLEENGLNENSIIAPGDRLKVSP